MFNLDNIVCSKCDSEKKASRVDEDDKLRKFWGANARQIDKINLLRLEFGD